MRDPARTIPRAIQIALAITVCLYLIVAVAALTAAGPAVLAASHRPIAAALDAAGAAWATPVVRIGAVLASLGSLLALIAGLGRTTLAMARNGDLPRWLYMVGLIGGVVLVAALPLSSVVAGVIVLAVGLGGRAALRATAT